jgi:hypothetical protein
MGTPKARPRDPQRPRRRGRYWRYFLFLRWMRVFFSSLRCFFFAMRLRRFLMTEPIRPPSSRHNGRRARHHADPGRAAGHTPGTRDIRVNANRSRSALAYLLPHGLVTPVGHLAPAPPPMRALSGPCSGSGGADEGRPEVLVHRLLGDPERATDSYGF